MTAQKTPEQRAVEIVGHVGQRTEHVVRAVAAAIREAEARGREPAPTVSEEELEKMADIASGEYLNSFPGYNPQPWVHYEAGYKRGYRAAQAARAWPVGEKDK